MCAHNQSRHNFTLQKCYCTTKKEGTLFMLFGADGKEYMGSPNVRKISYTQVGLWMIFLYKCYFIFRSF